MGAPSKKHKLTIPSTVAQVKRALDGINALLTATEWDKAALIYAFTRDDDKGGRPSGNLRDNPQVLGFSKFAELGIAGLHDRGTVARYHRAWARAVENGDAKPASPGEDVMVPGLPWPPDSKISEFGEDRRAAAEAAAAEEGVGVNKVADVMNNPKAVRAAIAADPKIAEAAVEGLAARSEKDSRLGMRAAGTIHEATGRGMAERRAVREEHREPTPTGGVAGQAAAAAALVGRYSRWATIAKQLREDAEAVRAEGALSEDDRLALLEGWNEMREALGDLGAALDAEFSIPDAPPLQ